MHIPVLIPRIFNYPLTYRSENETLLKEGDFVIVPFGKSKEIGVIWDKVQPTPKNVKIRSIEKKLEKIRGKHLKILRILNMIKLKKL